MNKGIVIFGIVILGLLIGIAIIDAGAKRPFDWSKNYSISSKNPFGLYILRQELANILTGDRQVQDADVSFYEKLDELIDQKKYDVALIDIGHGNNMYEEDVEKILEFVKHGGEIFLSSPNNYLLLDTLGIARTYLDYYSFLPIDTAISYTLVGEDIPVSLEKNDDYYVFDELNRNCTILGYLHVNSYVLPNFIEVKHGKGKLYIHLQPLALTNYNLLNDHVYQYASQVVNVIQSPNIFWLDFSIQQEKTPINVILRIPGFSHAWYILLLGLFLLLVFKSRREQRAVKVIQPEPNLSKDFAKAIGALYYESGQPGNIVKKKIDYFLYDLRVAYQIETIDLVQAKMIRTLSLRSGVAESEVKELMLKIQHYQKASDLTFDDVKMVNNIIEEFKRKANII